MCRTGSVAAGRDSKSAQLDVAQERPGRRKHRELGGFVPIKKRWTPTFHEIVLNNQLSPNFDRGQAPWPEFITDKTAGINHAFAKKIYLLGSESRIASANPVCDVEETHRQTALQILDRHRHLFLSTSSHLPARSTPSTDRVERLSTFHHKTPLC